MVQSIYPILAIRQNVGLAAQQQHTISHCQALLISFKGIWTSPEHCFARAGLAHTIHYIKSGGGLLLIFVI